MALLKRSLFLEGCRQPAQVLAGCHVVLDCLDNLTSRFVLEEACQILQIPLIHGAIAGFGSAGGNLAGEPLLSYLWTFYIPG